MCFPTVAKNKVWNSWPELAKGLFRATECHAWDTNWGSNTEESRIDAQGRLGISEQVLSSWIVYNLFLLGFSSLSLPLF